MALTAQLLALTVPFGTEFPPTPQALLELIAQYEAITGLEDFEGINYGATEPSEDNRDKPWFKTDDAGNPLGWYSWNGSAWTPIPSTVASGPTASRPLNAVIGQEYLDTDINVLLMYERSAWRTASGSPGDVKHVKVELLADALTANPGWSQDTDSLGLVIGGASDGSGQTYGTSAGSDSTMLTIDNLPSDPVKLLDGWGIFPGQFQNGTQSSGVNPITTGLGTSATKSTAPINPNTQTPVSILPPTKYYWTLVKD